VGFAVLFTWSTISALATTYYISPTGSDANSGTSQAQAWQTIGRLMQSIYSLQAGDAIRFERGGTYGHQQPEDPSGRLWIGTAAGDQWQ